MKNILLVICAVVFVDGLNPLNVSLRSHLLRHNPPPPPDVPESRAVTIENFYQQLDHYDPTNTDFWLQRYFVNDAYFDTTKRNVAFLMLGGEGTASAAWMTYGPWVASARKYKALLFQLEHRFYGVSQPFEDLSIENLRYLSSQQALADTATFIVEMNKKYNLSSDVKWILFGGSYAGSLAAWMREKYPHLVQGAMSASGPLLAKLDYYEYYQVVADDLATHSQDCVDVVRVAIEQVESLLANPGEETVSELFNLCEPIEDQLDNTLNVSSFFQSITVIFAAVAQYNNIPGTTRNINGLCDQLTDKSIGTEIHRLAELVNDYFGTGDNRCLDYNYDDIISSVKDLSTDGNDRQWTYQTCTEYGWYQTSSQEVPVFSSRYPIDFYTTMCADGFGEKFNETFISEQITRTNMDYGALDIETSNIVYVHGSFDPWHAVGLTKTTNPESPVILINGTAHCANFYEETANDVPGLIAAREEVDRLIGVWLGVNASENGQ